MKSVRIEPVLDGEVVLVDVVCDCGLEATVNEQTGVAQFKHRIVVADAPDTVLVCTGCGKKYRVHPQDEHIHVSNA
ncbi:MAG: hypothetical protein HY434_01030 [Candidatus Liptonbacteria bacterium]|nr:hypothetical protein [Candidatus Liptonbacteria bacterium]